MNSDTGEVKMFESLAQAEKEGFDFPVDPKDMTEQQTQRMLNDEQPVVKLQDNRSVLGKQRLKAARARQGFGYTQPKKKRRKNKYRGRR